MMGSSLDASPSRGPGRPGHAPRAAAGHGAQGLARFARALQLVVLVVVGVLGIGPGAALVGLGPARSGGAAAEAVLATRAALAVPGAALTKVGPARAMRPAVDRGALEAEDEDDAWGDESDALAHGCSAAQVSARRSMFVSSPVRAAPRCTPSDPSRLADGRGHPRGPPAARV